MCDPVGIRLLTRNGYDWSPRYPLIFEAVNHLKVRSCLIDGEALVCDKSGLAVFDLLRRKPLVRSRLAITSALGLRRHLASSSRPDRVRGVLLRLPLCNVHHHPRQQVQARLN
jgi:hypothetical protein